MRKIIQFQISSSNGVKIMVVKTNDDLFWELSETGWKRLPDIPQDMCKMCHIQALQVGRKAVDYCDECSDIKTRINTWDSRVNLAGLKIN